MCCIKDVGPAQVPCFLLKSMPITTSSVVLLAFSRCCLKRCAWACLVAQWWLLPCRLVCRMGSS